MIYSFIKKHEVELAVVIMCKVLEVSSSSYYQWKRSSIGIMEQRKADLRQAIIEVYFEFKQRYGSPRIT